MKINSNPNLLKLATAFMVAISLAGCSKEKDSEPMPPNNIASGQARITYTVQVVPAGTSANGRTQGLAGAIVSIVQGGKVISDTVGETGLAVFKNLAPGTVSGFIKATNYLSTNFTSTLDQEFSAGDSAIKLYISSSVRVYATNCRLAGRVFGDFDLTNINPNPNLPAYTRGGIRMRVSYKLNNYPMGSGPGRLSSVSIQPQSFVNSTNVLGGFDFTKLASTEDGVLSADLVMEDYLVNTVQGNARIFRLAQPINNLRLRSGAVTQTGDILAIF